MSRASSVGHFARRAGLIGVDQALSSAGNFALTILVARQSTPSQFAHFGVAIGLYFVVLALVRALASDPFVILSADSQELEQRLMRGWSVTGSLLVGLASSITILIVALLWSSGRDYLVPIAVCLPALALHEHLRQILIAQRRVWIPLVADAVWLASFGLLATLLYPFSAASTPVWVWAGTGVATALASVGASRATPRVAELARWGVDVRRVGVSYSVQLLLGAIWWQIVALVAVASMDAERAAGIRGAGVLLAVGSMASTVVVTTAFPSIARAATRDLRRMRRTVVSVIGAVVASVVSVAVIVRLLPDDYGQSLLGDSWASAESELLLQTSTFVTMGVVSVVALAMRAIQRLIAGAVVMLGASAAMLGATLASASATPRVAGLSTTLVGLLTVVAVGCGVVRVVNKPSAIK